MKIRWNQTEEFEVIDKYDEATDNIDECHNQLFKKGETDEIDIIGDEDSPNVTIQFGNGSTINSLYRMAFSIVDERDSTPEDCEQCDEENCDIKHCTISGPHEDKFPPTDPLLVAAQEIVNDFDNYGEVLQEDDNQEYGPDSAIEKLRAALGGKHDTVTIQEIRYVAEYEAMTQNEQVNYLMFEHSMDEKEAWEYRTDSAYDLPYEIASEFEDFDESKYPDENR